jgi:hypothetical protein
MNKKRRKQRQRLARTLKELRKIPDSNTKTDAIMSVLQIATNYKKR